MYQNITVGQGKILLVSRERRIFQAIAENLRIKLYIKFDRAIKNSPKIELIKKEF